MIYDGEDVKALAPNMGDLDSEDNIQACGIIRIPTRAVVRIVPVAEVEQALSASSFSAPSE